MAQNFLSDIKLGDNIHIRLGDATSGDFKIKHNGDHTFMDNHTGNVYIRNYSDDKNIHFQTDDGSGDITDYIVVHGSENIVKFQENTRHLDNKQARFGTGSDLKIFHDGTNNQIRVEGGSLDFEQHVDDGTIRFYNDDGSGGQALYFYLDGSTVRTQFNKQAYFIDDAKVTFGDGEDLQIYHDGSNSYIDNNTGWLNIPLSQNGMSIANADFSASIAKFLLGGAVELYHNGSKKFETASTGIKVSGDVMPSTDGGAKLGAGSGTNLRWAGIELSNGAGIQWTNGDARIIEGLVNNYSLSFQTYDGSALSTALRLDGDNLATFAGQIRTTQDIGRDDHNRIMFSTDDSIIFRVADSHRFRMDSDTFRPYTDSSYDLGTNSVRWRNLYADTLYGDGSNLTNISATFSGGTIANATTFSSDVDFDGHITLTGSSKNIVLNYGNEIRTKDSNGTERTVLRAASNKLQYGWSYNGAVEFMGGGSYSPRITIQTDGTVLQTTTTIDGTLGIGGSSPVSTSALTIKSKSTSSQQSAIDIIQNGGTNAIIRMGEKSTDGGRFHMFDGGTEKIAFYTDGTDNHISAGNLAIGSNSAGGKLDITQSSATDPVLRLTDDGVANYDFIFPDTSTIKLETNTSSTKTFKLLNAGSGDFNFEASAATFAGNISTAADKRISIGTWDNSAFTGGAAHGYYVSAGTPILILEESDQSKTGYVGVSGGNMYVGGVVTNLILQSGNGSNALTIDSSQNATFAGDVSLTSGHELTVNNAVNNNNLGIHIKNDNNLYSGALTFWTEYSGTDTHAARVQAGTNGTDAALYLQVANTSKTLTSALTLDFNLLATFAGQINAIGGSAGAPSIIFEGDSDTGFYHASSNAIDIATQGVHRVRINNTGVGIGTNNPDESLHIKNSDGANIILNSDANTNDSGIYMSEGADATPTQNGAYVYYDASENAFKIATGSSSLTDRLTIARDNGFATFAGNGQFDTSLKINAPDGGGSPAMTAIINMHGYEGRGVGIKMKDNVNSASGATDREWFVGTGYGQSSFNIGYSSTGSQSSYTAQSKLTIATDGNATLAGDLLVNTKVSFIGNSGDHSRITYTQGDGTTGDVWQHAFYQNSGLQSAIEFFATDESTGDGLIRFKAGGNYERMRILTGGYVAIGQTTAYAPTGGGSTMLTVTRTANEETNLVVSNQANHASAEARLIMATYGHDFIISGTSSLGGSKLMFHRAGTELLRFGGVNATTNDATFAGKIKTTSTGSATVAAIQLRPQVDGEGLGISAPATDQMNFITADSTRMILDSSGDLTMKGGRVILRESDDGNDAVKITRDADEGYVQLFSSGTQTVELRGNGVSYINGGNFGIGASNPSYKLQVQGTFYVNDTAYINGNTEINAKLLVTDEHIVHKSSSPEFYFHTSGNHYNWMIAAQENVDGGLEFGHSSGTATSLDTDASNYTRTLTLKHDNSALFKGDINLDTLGSMISFYGNSSGDHAIMSKGLNGNAEDDIRINSYGGVFINLDSNGNNDNSADFQIVRHSSTGAVSASDTLFTLRHEDGYATFSGDVQINGDLTITGTSTTVNVEDLNVEQGEITLNYGSGDTSSSADGAGIRIQDAQDANNDATMSWVDARNAFSFSHPVIVNATSQRDTSNPAMLSVQGGMSEFETTLTNNYDWQNSPVSILERANIGAGSTDNKYSPNLNFHWSTKVSRSLWMDASGHLHFGAYNASGVPNDTSGHFLANEVHATVFKDKGSTGYYLDPAGTGTALNIAGHANISNNVVKISTDGTYGGSYGTVAFGGISNGSNRVFGHTGTGDGLFLASATGRGIFFRVNGGSTDNISFNSDGSATFTGQLKIESAYPTILLTDTNHNDDWGIYNNNGKFLVYNQTDAVSSFQIDQSNNSTFAGSITVNSNGLLSTASTTSATTTTTIASVAIATYTAAFFDYSIKNGTNVRAGTVVATHDGTNVEFNETSTVDLGDTSDVTLSVDISSGDMRLRATTTSSTWTIKALIRGI